jgi:hypothetical protein
MAAIHPLSSSLAPLDAPAPDPVSPVRVLLGRYQQVLDRVEEGKGLMWAPFGRRRFTRWMKTPAPRPVVLALLTVHVRARLRVLERRNNARIALLKETEQARRDHETLTQFLSSLRRTPGAKLVVLGALAGVLMAALLLTKLMAFVPGVPALLGNLTKAALTADPGDMIDAVTKSHLDAASLMGLVVVILWSLALVVLPVVPAAGAVRHLVATQPGLPQAETAGFAALRARRPVGLELGLLVEACLVLSTLLFFLPTSIGLLATGEAGWGVAAGSFALALLLTGFGLRARLDGRRPTLVLRIARRVMLFQFWAFGALMGLGLILYATV